MGNAPLFKVNKAVCTQCEFTMKTVRFDAVHAACLFIIYGEKGLEGVQGRTALENLSLLAQSQVPPEVPAVDLKIALAEWGIGQIAVLEEAAKEARPGGWWEDLERLEAVYEVRHHLSAGPRAPKGEVAALLAQWDGLAKKAGRKAAHLVRSEIWGHHLPPIEAHEWGWWVDPDFERRRDQGMLRSRA
jgi:hypothetical protein